MMIPVDMPNIGIISGIISFIVCSFSGNANFSFKAVRSKGYILKKMKSIDEHKTFKNFQVIGS